MLCCSCACQNCDCLGVNALADDLRSQSNLMMETQLSAMAVQPDLGCNGALLGKVEHAALDHDANHIITAS